MGFISNLLNKSPQNDALLAASRMASTTPEEMQGLIKAGGNPKVAEYRKDPMLKAFQGFTPLHYVCKSPSPNQAALVKFLIGQKVDVNARTPFDATPLHVLAGNGYAKIESLDLLLAAKADVKAMDSTGQTALHFAARLAQFEMVERLIKAGADVRALPPRSHNYNGITPLHEALMGCEHGEDCLHIIKSLIKAGASPDDETRQGESALWFGIHRQERISRHGDMGGQGYVEHASRLDKAINFFKTAGMDEPPPPPPAVDETAGNAEKQGNKT